MKITITGNGQKLEIAITIVWASARALMKAVLLVIGATTALVTAPEWASLIATLVR